MTQRADDFRVVAMADQEDGAPGLGIGGDFLVDLRHQRAGCVDHGKSAIGGLPPYRRADAVRAEYDPHAFWHMRQVLHEYHASRSEIGDNMLVVNNVVTHKWARTAPAPARRCRSRERRLHRTRGLRTTFFGTSRRPVADDYDGC
jgi:hypothetical protein